MQNTLMRKEHEALLQKKKNQQKKQENKVMIKMFTNTFIKKVY